MSGFGQGIRRSVFSTAAILGPLWAGGTVSFSYYILLGVPCGLLLFVTVCMPECLNSMILVCIPNAYVFGLKFHSGLGFSPLTAVAAFTVLH